MLQIKSVVFDKGDFAYTIEYFDGKTVRKISTNEEALNSMTLARTALGVSLKKFLKLSEIMNCKVNSVRFAKNDDSASIVQLSVWSGLKQMGVVTKVHPVRKSETNPDEEMVSVFVNCDSLRGEVEKYISGERAQQSLDFGAPEEGADA